MTETLAREYRKADIMFEEDVDNAINDVINRIYKKIQETPCNNDYQDGTAKGLEIALKIIKEGNNE